MGIRLDELDRLALQLLQRNGRLTNRSLAKVLGLSETACAARVRRLETAGYIVGYAAILADTLNSHGVRAWVDVRLPESTPTVQQAFEAALLRDEDVVAAYRTAGPADYLVKIGADHVADIESFFERLCSVEVTCHAVRQVVILRSVKSMGSSGLLAR